MHISRDDFTIQEIDSDIIYLEEAPKRRYTALSLTNAMDDVLCILIKEFGETYFKGKILLYKDTDGDIDQIEFDASSPRPEPIFRFLSTPNLSVAIDLARERPKNETA